MKDSWLGRLVLRFDRGVLVLVAVALATRAAWWASWVSMPENEGMQYIRRAENWLGGHGYVNLQGAPDVMATPLYPGLIAGVSLLTGSFETAARLVSLFGGLATLLLVFAVTRRAFGRITALVAGFIVAVHPVLVALSVSAYGESLGMALTLAALYFALRVSDSASAWFPIASGGAVGLGYLTRPEIIAFALPVAVYVAWRRVKSGPWQTGLLHAALCVGVALVLAAPYSIRISRIAGSFRWEGKTGPNELINERIQRGMSELEASRGLDVDSDFDRHAPYLGGPELWADQSAFLRRSERARTAGDALRAIPKRIPRVIELYWTWGRQWSSLFKVPLGFAALVLGFVATRFWRGPERSERFLLLAFLGLQAAVPLGVLFLWPRYVYPVLPFAIPWVASGAAWAGDLVLRWLRPALSDHARGRWVVAACLLAVLAVSVRVTTAVAWLDDFSQSNDSPARDAGLWLREQPRASDRGRPLIMVTRSAIVHYAGGTLTYLPYTRDVSRALRYIHWKRPDFIAVSSRYLLAPYLEQWMKHGIPDACAIPLRRFGSEGSEVRVWRWNCTD
jgi:4-amino-4-deoxy-L-arabinose transferase-like glycosyltransferase